MRALAQPEVLLKRLALAAAVLAIGVAIAVGGRAWDQFSSSDLQFPNQPEQHFGQLSGAGRHDFYRVAIDAFGEKPVLGHGAGTYEFSWERAALDRPCRSTTPTRSTWRPSPSSGWSAGCSCSAWFGLLLWTGFAAWRDAGGSRSASSTPPCSPRSLAFAVGAAIDWFWEIAALGAIFFLAGGVLVAARCAQLARSARRAPAEHAEQRRYGLAVAGLALAWISRAGADRAAAGRPRDRSRARRAAADGDIDQRRQPRRTRPARSSPGPPPPTCSSGCSPSCRATTRPRSGG